MRLIALKPLATVARIGQTFTVDDAQARILIQTGCAKPVRTKRLPKPIDTSASDPACDSSV